MKLKKIRHDINSLRFFAALLVLLSHLSVTGFENGFIGVDVFFVISGFFITSILNEKLDKKKIQKFILSRIKRLIPNLFLICFLIFFISIKLLPNYILDNLYINFFSSIFGFANINFTSQSGDYFGPSSTTNPFLHIWSLSVEKHFYLIFLLIFILFNYFLKEFKIYIIFVLTLISFLLSLDLSKINHFYYLTPIRIFEFGIGCIAYLLSKERKFEYQNCLSLFAIFFFILSMIFIEKNVGIPGYQVIFPCLAIAIILVTPNSIFNNFINSNSLSYLGKISFLIYLVHWPIIIFSGFYFELTIIYKILIFIISILVSSILFHTYENTLRYSDIKFNIFLLISFLIILLISFLFINKVGGKEENMFQKMVLENRYLRYGEEKNISKFDFNNIEKNSILFIGDSFADDLYLGLKDDSFTINKTPVYKTHVDTICFNIKHKRPMLGKIFKKKGTCEQQIEDLEKIILNNNFQAIFLINHWKIYNYNLINDAIKITKNANNQKLYIVAMRETFANFDQILNRSKNIDKINQDFYLNKNQLKNINLQLKKISDGKKIFFYEPKQICDEEISKCEVIDKKTNEIKYLDYSHYSLNYSKEIISDIKKLINKN